jgi:hypothetical protein
LSHSGITWVKQVGESDSTVHTQQQQQYVVKAVRS